MIDIHLIDIQGILPAILGMRNSYQSRNKSDSKVNHFGINDIILASKLAEAGPSHSKYRRMIIVWADITAPLYWWKEFDTYKIGTVANSESTMHSVTKKEFEISDFSIEHLTEGNKDGFEKCCIKALNTARENYLETKDKLWWWQIIQQLPSSYNQMRTVMLNYEVLANIYNQRKNHKLDEWLQFCEWIKQLPYADEIIIAKGNDK